MTLRELAAASGLSQSFLSQLERGQTQASVGSLRRVAEGLSLTIPDLFQMSGAPGPRVVRSAARPALPFGNNTTKYLHTVHAHPDIEAFTMVLGVDGSTGDGQYSHGDSEELIVVTVGAIKIELGDDVLMLEVGDSISFRSSVPHRVSNIASGESTVLWVVSQVTT